MKTFLANLAAALPLVLAGCSSNPPTYSLVEVDAPFEMQPLKEFQFPDGEYVITDFGADSTDAKATTDAIARAMAECSKAGGGKVVVPAGAWKCGPVHFKSNVNLHLSEGARLRFVDTPEAYLPAVPTSWEGMECYNYSPLVYAYECDNIAITGSGTLEPYMDTWRVWFKRPEPHLNALKELYTMASEDVPVEQRQMAKGENNMRPHLIHFNRCNNVLLDGFKIRESPFWTIHLYLCDNAIARNLDVRAHGHNNDGIDLEMTRNVLVENCRFDQGDDAVVIKSGRNQDAWRINRPTENVVVRNCNILKGHVLLGIGSEISGGVRNIYMHDCEAPDSVFRLCFVKTNHRRGGFVENITMENVKAGAMQRVLEIDTDVLYQWRDLVPTYKDSITRIDGVYLNNIECARADAVYDVKGDSRLPVKNVKLNNVRVGKVAKFISHEENVDNLEESGVTVAEAPSQQLHTLD